MDVYYKDLIFKSISELKKTEYLLTLIGDNEYKSTGNIQKSCNKEFLKDKN